MYTVDLVMREVCSDSALLVNDWSVEWRYEHSKVLVLFYEPASMECMRQTVATQACASMWERLRGTAVLESCVTWSCTLQSSTWLQLLILFQKHLLGKPAECWKMQNKNAKILQCPILCLGGHQCCFTAPGTWARFTVQASRWIGNSKIASRFKWVFKRVCECFCGAL